MTDHTIQVPAEIDRAWQAAKAARTKAYARYSNFLVGAALIDEKGTVHHGCNVENASYGGTVCAERGATFRMVADGGKEVREVVVVTDTSPPAFPCALCLQVLGEFATSATRVWLADTKGIREVVPFKTLLPRHFGPQSLEL